MDLGFYWSEYGSLESFWQTAKAHLLMGLTACAIDLTAIVQVTLSTSVESLETDDEESNDSESNFEGDDFYY